MRKIILTLFLIFFGTLPQAKAQAQAYRMVVVGDSLSAGYNLSPKDAFYTQLEAALKAKGYNIVVESQSRSGETANGGRGRMKTIMEQRPSVVILELGINDAFRRVPVENINKNLESMIETFLHNNVPVLLVGMQAPPNMPGSYQKDFTNMYKNLAKKHDLILYPFFMEGIISKKNLLSGGSPYLLDDMVHPSAEGVKVMVKNILPTVEKFLKRHGIRN